MREAGQDEAAKAAQAKVEEYYDKVFSQGYFRDSYNPTNLLWLFGLSWWQDVKGMLNSNGNMEPAQAQKLLQMLAADREGFFAASPEEQKVWDGWTKREMVTYFQEKYTWFKTFLIEAVTRNETIVCSS